VRLLGQGQAYAGRHEGVGPRVGQSPVAGGYQSLGRQVDDQRHNDDDNGQENNQDAPLLTSSRLK